MFEILPNWHPMLVHFTVALSVFSLLAYLLLVSAQRYSIRNKAMVVGRWSLWFVGVVTLFTLAAGLYAYNTVDHDDVSHQVMTTHRNWAVGAALLLFLAAALSWWFDRREKEEGKGFVALLLAAVLGIGVTAWYGGELVYRHGLGVQSLPGGHCQKCLTGERRGHDTLMGADELSMPEHQESPPAEHDDGHDHTH